MFTLAERKRLAGSVYMLLRELKTGVREAKRTKHKTHKQKFLMVATHAFLAAKSPHFDEVRYKPQNLRQLSLYQHSRRLS
jgi:hypothetical protein